MFCPKCGTQVPEGAAFCGGCGNRLNQAAQPTPPVQPAYNQQPVRPAQPVYAPQPVAPRKQNGAKSVLVVVTMLLSLVLIAASVVAPLATAFYKIPAFSLAMVIAEGEDDVDYMMDSLGEGIEELEEELEHQEDVMEDDEFEAAEEMVDSVKKLHKNFSILNARSTMKLVEEVNGEFDMGIEQYEIDQLIMALNIVVAVIVGFFVLPLLFTLLGGLLKSTGLTITAIVFTAISQLIFSGLLLFVLSLAVGIVQAILCSQLKKSRMSV